MSTVQVEDTLKEIVTDACNPVTKQGKRCRGLNPWHKDDYQRLTFLAKGERAVNGFRNKDLCVHLFPQVDACDLKYTIVRGQRRRFVREMVELRGFEPLACTLRTYRNKHDFR